MQQQSDLQWRHCHLHESISRSPFTIYIIPASGFVCYILGVFGQMSKDFGAKMHGNQDFMAIFGFKMAKWNKFLERFETWLAKCRQPSGGKEQ